MESLAGKTSEEVEVLKLAKNGRNWKIYHVKIVEATATDITDLLGVLAGWEPDNGSYDWECRDAILKWTFYTLVPISILCPIRKLDTADQIFKYLAKCFRDSEPIPRTNEFQCAGTAAAAETPEKSPMSADTATEWHASAERNNEDLTTTKALTQGTQDVNNRNVRRTQDPCTSLGASAQGTSAKCAETTPVMLKSVLPHETQTKLQNSLPLTLRLPVEGEPSGCKQEVVESVVTAGRTNGMVETAEPTEIMDVDRMALLGGEPAERVHIVDEGDETEREPQMRLQQTGFYCEESCQHSGNAMDNIPVAHGVPLEGEWTWCASGEASDPKLDGIELEGCASGMDEWACVDKAGGNAGHGTGPVDTLNELTEFVTLSIESEDLGGSDIPRVRLGGMQMRTGDANGSRGQMDWSDDQTDEPRGQMYVLNQSSNAEMAGISHGDGAGMYLGAGDAKRGVEVTNGIGSQMDMSIGRGDAQSIKTDADISANETQIVRLPRKKVKLPDLPSRSARTPPDKPNGVGDHTDVPNAQTDVQGDGNEAEMSEKDLVNIRIRQTRRRMPNSMKNAKLDEEHQTR